VTNPYTVEKSPIHQTTKVNTSWSVLNKKNYQSAEEEKKDMQQRRQSFNCPEICIFSIPLAENARIRAHFSGLHRAG